MYLSESGRQIDVREVSTESLTLVDGKPLHRDWEHVIDFGPVRLYSSKAELFTLLHTIEKALGMDKDGRSPDPGEIEDALKDAKDAHGEHEARTGEPDANWPAWYAKRMAAFFRKNDHERTGKATWTPTRELPATWIEGRPGGGVTGPLSGPSPLNPEEPLGI